MNNLKLKTKVHLFFGFLIVISTINFSLLIMMEDIAEEDSQWVIHTYEVISESEILLGHLRDAETGQRGYLLTGKEEYLEPYTSGIKYSQESYKNLKQLTSDNEVQQLRLKQIKRLMDKKFIELKTTIDLYKANKPEESLLIVLSDQGKEFMDTLRLEIDSFQVEEERLLEIRSDRFTTIQSQIRNIFLIEAIVFVLAVIIMAYFYNKTVAAPILTLKNAAERFRKKQKYTPVDIHNTDEIGDLAKSFNQMGQQITDSMNLLIHDQQNALIERDQAIQEASTDPLTGLKSRRYLYDEASHQISICFRYEYPMSIIMLDIDYFKKINDNFGHSVGDIVLKTLGEHIKGHTRASDLDARYGGEEFVIILPSTKVEDAVNVAENLRESVESIEVPELKGSNFTISLGVTGLQKDDDINSLIERADKALYQSKNNGRNRVTKYYSG